jgi:hypothetical protein
MAWSALPVELEEIILAKLSLFELAFASRTCRTFSEFARTQLAKAQEARFNLAIECFGRGRVVGLVGLIDRFLKGVDVTGQRVGEVCLCSMSHDGVPSVEEPTADGQGPTYEPGEMHMRVCRWNLPALVGCPRILQILVPTSSGSELDLYFCSVFKNAFITMRPCADEAVACMALLQALLCLGLASNLNDAWPDTVHLVNAPSMWGGSLTLTGLQSQMAPLLPLIAQHRNLYLLPVSWGCGLPKREEVRKSGRGGADTSWQVRFMVNMSGTRLSSST